MILALSVSASAEGKKKFQPQKGGVRLGAGIASFMDTDMNVINEPIAAYVGFTLGSLRAEVDMYYLQAPTENIGLTGKILWAMPFWKFAFVGGAGAVMNITDNKFDLVASGGIEFYLFARIYGTAVLDYNFGNELGIVTDPAYPASGIQFKIALAYRMA